MGKTLVAIACALCVTLSASTATGATTLAIGGAYYVGLITPGTPSDPSSQVEYINALIQLAPSTVVVDCVGTNDCDRTGSTIPTSSLGTALTATQTTVPENRIATASQNIAVSGYMYIIAKYAAGNAGAYVWYISGLTSVNLPTHAGGTDGAQHALSNYSVVTGTPRVPDGGATAGLLGLALLGLGYLRRRVA
jgi:hypothetical protein